MRMRRTGAPDLHAATDRAVFIPCAHDGISVWLARQLADLWPASESVELRFFGPWATLPPTAQGIPNAYFTTLKVLLMTVRSSSTSWGKWRNGGMTVPG